MKGEENLQISLLNRNGYIKTDFRECDSKIDMMKSVKRRGRGRERVFELGRQEEKTGKSRGAKLVRRCQL